MTHALRVLSIGLLWASSVPAAETGDDSGDQPGELPDLRLHAIVEAPMDVVNAQVVEVMVSPVLAERLSERHATSAPRDRVPFALQFARQEGDLRALLLNAPEGRTVARFRTRKLDAYLTLISIIHGRWGKPTPEKIKLRDRMERQWRHALVRLHMRFPEPVVETWRRRPRDVEGEFVERNLLANGDFEMDRPGGIEGVAPEWEINRAEPAPQVHAVDEKVFHSGSRSQRITQPPDWSHYAVQQFTPDASGLIGPGRRYVLTGYVRADGITNPAGWYKLGLWAAGADGTPIGDMLKNEQLADDAGKPVLNHDWRRFEIKGTAPPGATRAVVILTGHWDQGGTVWYDDLRLWPEMPPATTAGK